MLLVRYNQIKKGLSKHCWILKLHKKLQVMMPQWAIGGQINLRLELWRSSGVVNLEWSILVILYVFFVNSWWVLLVKTQWKHLISALEVQLDVFIVCLTHGGEFFWLKLDRWVHFGIDYKLTLLLTMMLFYCFLYFGTM